MNSDANQSNLSSSTSDADLWKLYRQMLWSRLFEEAVQQLWEQGKISGEMHLGMGEEAIAAGVVCQMQAADALALDHRGTPPMLMRGVDPALLLREFLGQPDGLCKGMGGHMHLFAPEQLAASSGIVGAAGPAAVGFALAAQYLRPGALAVAFFGEGAVNQGMMMEAFNLAVVWKLPVLFICKDNDWAISTRSLQVTGGDLLGRARGFGMEAVEVDGSEVEEVWGVARVAMRRARDEEGPTFVRARCIHQEGHFLGDQMLRIARKPWRELPPIAGPMLRSLLNRKGTSFWERARGVASILRLILRANRDSLARRYDPVWKARQKLQEQEERLWKLEAEVRREIEETLKAAEVGNVNVRREYQT